MGSTFRIHGGDLHRSQKRSQCAEKELEPYPTFIDCVGNDDDSKWSMLVSQALPVSNSPPNLTCDFHPIRLSTISSLGLSNFVA
jgi:hypothetical protein